MIDISVLIPFYKGNEFINETLVSIETALSNINYEIIIINDSPDVAIQLNKEYKNLSIYINPKNLGIAKSRNIAYEKSTGKYILFLDQDDMLEPYGNIKDYLNTKKLLILNFYELTYKNKTLFYKKNPFNLVEKIDECFLLKVGPLFRTVSQFLFDRELFEPFIASEKQGADDFFFYCDLYKKTTRNQRLYVKKPQIVYRLHQGNYSKTADFYGSLNEIFIKWNNRNNNQYSGFEKYYFSKSLFWRIVHKLTCVLLIGK